MTTIAASPWALPTQPTGPAPTQSLSDIMANEQNQHQQHLHKCHSLSELLPHLSTSDCEALLQLSHNDVAQAITKAFELGHEGLELLLRPPKSQEDIDHDLAVALSLAGDVDQTTTATPEPEDDTVLRAEDCDLSTPVKPRGIMRHDKGLSEQYNAARLSGRPGVGDLQGTKISNRVYNTLSNLNHRKSNMKKGCSTSGGGGRKDTTSALNNGTSEGVLDQRTRKIVMALINRNVLDSMGGVIATGKEASAFAAYGVGSPIVEHHQYGQHRKGKEERQERVVGSSSTGTTLGSTLDLDSTPDSTADPTSDPPPTTTTTTTNNTESPPPRDPPRHLVVKIFRTTLSKFKNRAEYVDGDSRYAKAKFKHIKTTNALKMWSNKEYRNLIRMHRAGIPCPVPLYQTDHTLVMSMVTKYSSRRSGVPALQLRESKLSPQRLRHAFLHVVVAMRGLYQRAKLVHGDLSEFNILYVGGKERPVVFIDVGQAVDLSHPKHMVYLGRDCRCVLDFFERKSKALHVSFGLPSVEELVVFVVEEEKKKVTEEEGVESLTHDAVDGLVFKRLKRLLDRGWC